VRIQLDFKFLIRVSLLVAGLIREDLFQFGHQFLAKVIQLFNLVLIISKENDFVQAFYLLEVVVQLHLVGLNEPYDQLVNFVQALVSANLD